ncbi:MULTISPECIES: glycosyltransferase family 4 protein [Bacteroides]|jgi:glycosyltransferase involved in cell wall biosynthesis|uniref:glycosyltransferase family 4 protein n=1 Tax=Bacteroides TaxID=816 RepID=UPI000E4761A1|nr:MULTISPECIES: glycosyltransferase family 4 protein [Bacteroides]RHL04566.1 glycosyltransferase [Bacteroides sp. AF39-11AC]
MKILFLTQDITVKGIPRAYNTGFSLMVAQIAAALAAEGTEVYVSSSSLTNDTTVIYSGTGEKQFTLLERKLKYLLTYLRWKDIPRAICHALSSHKMSIAWRIKLLKYTISIGFNIHLIRKTNPDVIFIHSLGPEVLPFISAALHTGKPFALALHGLFSQANKDDFTTQGEIRLLPSLLQSGMPLTVVSSGMHNKLLNLYEWKECKNIYVVPNALNDDEETENAATDDPWTETYRILTIGNLNENKNQLQILRAFSLLPTDIKEKSQLCLIGKDALNGQLQKEAENLGISQACIFTGSLPHNEVFRWIRNTKVVVLASKLEGFGLSIIEGYHYGVPAVCFDRIDAFEDLYHEKCMTPVYEYNDKALADAIHKTLIQQWDKNFIRAFAGKFSNHAMASAYLNILRQAQVGKLTEKTFNRLVDKYLS